MVSYMYGLETLAAYLSLIRNEWIWFPIIWKKSMSNNFLYPWFLSLFSFNIQTKTTKMVCFHCILQSLKICLALWLQKRSGCQKTISHNTVFTLKNICRVYKSFLQKNWMLRYLEATSCKPNWNIPQFFIILTKLMIIMLETSYVALVKK